MPASIGVNLRVTGHCSQGGRKYMEDFFAVAYQQTEDEKDLEYAFFGIYDGHGGGEAATYAKEHLMESIVRQKMFWSDKDEDVLKAIKEGYIATHYAMWKEQEKWPKTASGLPSTAGTTATIAFIRRAKIFIGHVGDSGVVLGYQEPGESNWKARPLTKDHKPENENEMSRIEQCGGKVITKSGVPRVVWNRPRIGHKGPVRRSTPIDEIPFLAVARSLGDLWSYNSALDEFVVSPDPDTCVIPIDTNTFRCLIFGTDGLWNMISPHTAVAIVQITERHNEKTMFTTNSKGKIWINPSKSLVEHSLERWSTTKMRADNTTAVTLLLDPPGPPRGEVIKIQRRQSVDNGQLNDSRQNDVANCSSSADNNVQYPATGLHILTRYPTETVDNVDKSVPYPISGPIPTSAFLNGKSNLNCFPNNDVETSNQVNKSKELNSSDSSPTASPYNIKMVEKTPVRNESCTIYIREYQSDDENGNSSTSRNTEIEKPPSPEPSSAISDECKRVSDECASVQSNLANVSKISEQIENIQINEISSSSPHEEKVETENKKKGDVKNGSKFNFSKSIDDLSGPCTRSHDNHKVIITRQTRGVLNNKPISRSTRSQQAAQSVLSMKTRSNERRSLRNNNNILQNEVKRGRKRLISDGKQNENTKNVTENINERVSFPIEPAVKKPKPQACFVAIQTLPNRSLTPKTRKGCSENDENGSDEENKLIARFARSNREPPLENISRTRGRPPKPACATVEITTSENQPSCSNMQNRNLRERNIITQSSEEKLTLRSRTNTDQQKVITTNLTLPGRLNKSNPNISSTVNKKPGNIAVAKKLMTRNSWLPSTSKSTIQTRNRVKRFSK